jgi:hypothetical protein
MRWSTHSRRIEPISLSAKTVLPRRTGRNRLVANPHRSQTTPAIDPISITDQVAWCLVPGESLGDLPRDPFGRRMRRYVDPDKLPPRQPDNDQCIEQVEPNGRHDKRVRVCASLAGAQARLNGRVWVSDLGGVEERLSLPRISSGVARGRGSGNLLRDDR